ncbi:ATP-binding protein [Paraglaciecola sp.]|uniref:ATP-binding protein n=1 Tax=Paraglaciecola sp. TaxID=1920173 RepID=UPI00273E3854|nr:ATP-binding protein [Paraglaciecola sp.]MDP5031344.1 ATP-binding protein [Paraglaciecola sp.]
MKSRKKKGSIPVLISLAVILMGVMFYGLGQYFLQQQILTQERVKLANMNKKAVGLIESHIAQSQNKLQFLFSTPPIAGIARAINNGDIDPLDGTTSEQWKVRLHTILKAFIKTNPEIRQIRLIGQADNGKELVRVEKLNNQVVVTPEGLLQEKGREGYFQAVANLEANQNYTSDITLNREFGVIDTPVWPTYRVAQPVYGESNVFFGMLILNVDVSELIRMVQQELVQSGLDFYLLNSQGFFISAPDTSLLFGFDLDQPQATWQTLTDNSLLPRSDTVAPVSIAGGQGHVSSHKITLSTPEERALYVVTVLPETTLSELWLQQRLVFVMLLIFLFSVVILVIYAYQRYANKILNLYNDQSRYEAVIAGSSDAIVVLDRLGFIQEWNEAAAFLFGMDDTQAKDRSLFELLVAEDASEMFSVETLAEVIDKKTPTSLEIKTTNFASNTNYLVVSLSPVIPKNKGMTAHVSAIIRDITEKRVNQLQIVGLNASLEQQVQDRTKQLEAVSIEAKKANQTKSHFVANISHEIRTPLNGIGGMLELLTREPLSAKQEAYLKMAKNSVATLTVLINDLLDLSKMESGKLDIEPASFNLLETSSVVISSLALKAHEKGLNLMLDWAEVRHENIISDGYRIKQILVNLLANAIKFTEKGQIVVSLSTRLAPDNEHVFIEIAVKDTGIGITEEQQTRLFQPFSQANSSIEKDFGGTGLGLSISKELAKLLGGEIAVSSEIGRGTTFTFMLTAPLEQQVKNKTIGSLLSGRRCLLVMAEQDESDTLIRQLHAWGALALASDSIEDLYTIDPESLPDLIIVDSSLVDGAFERWFDLMKASHRCKLMLLLPSADAPITFKESDDCQHLIKPILPAAFLMAYQGLRHPEQKFSHRQLVNKIAPLAVHTEQSYTVLIVDDNEINRYVAQGMLERLPIQFYTATNGAEAIECLQSLPSEHHIDLILMDCQMPILNGFEATQAIRRGDAGDQVQDVTIIAMTAGAMAGDRDACLQAGMNDFVSKPLDAPQFEHLVLAYLQQRTPANLGT